MATIAENLQTIQNIKQDIKRAIENKGVDMTNTPFTEYSTKIDEISSGGGTGGDTTNYSYLVPTADVEGLKALGWDDESIGYFKDNNLCYEWQKDDFKVSEENKVLYGVVDKNNYKEYKDNPNMNYLPLIDVSNTIINFQNFKHIKGFPLIKNLYGSSLQYFFQDCSLLKNIPPFDTSNMTNMYYTFNGCSSLQTIPKLNTSKVTNMGGCFQGCKNLISIPHLDTSKVTSMYGMFRNCSLLTTIPHIDTSNVTSMDTMFQECTSLQTIPKLNTSKVTVMTSCFSGCISLTSVPELDTSNTTAMNFMFSNCKNLVSIPKLDTSKATNMNSMFTTCSILKTIPAIDTSNATNIGGMFSYCYNLESLPLLDCGNVTAANNIFAYSNYNKLTYLGGFKDLKISITSYFLALCPNLTTESLMNVINNLYDLTANGISGKTLKFGTTNLNKLTAEQIAVATAKGWTLT